MDKSALHALRILLTVLSLICVRSVGAQPNPKCLSYEPAVVKLAGVMISRTYPGPPNYESIRGGDEPETYWFLVLSHPICVNEKLDGFDPATKNIRRVQLVVFGEDADRKYGRLLGKRVTATGTLFGANTGHHRTPVLLTVSTMERAKSHPHR